ncbi:hypothetical protein ABGT15_04285 [Flavobacterium enshiense]|uniref:hypothetical protein n=1 Tax=Flavobacterium enshiense TaxID=1341165 RepID=UPI00345D5F40
MRITYDLIDSKQDITLGKWLEYGNISNTEDVDIKFLQAKRLEIFAGLSLEDALLLEQWRIDEIEERISIITNEENKFVTTFEFGGIEYGFIPDFSEFVTSRELIDADFYLEKQDHVRLLSILYRPISFKDGDKYRIDPYTKTHTLFKDLRYDIYEASMGFFLNGLLILGQATLRFIEDNLKETKMSSLEKHNLLKSMEDIQKWYTSFQVVI